MINEANAQEAKGRPAKPAAAPQADLEALNAAIRAQEQKVATAQNVAQGQTIWWTTTNAMTMSASVLIFGLLTLCLAAYVIRRGHAWDGVLKIFGMVLVIVLTAFLIVAGYDDKQIAPAVGLLGTIAGYLLGKEVAKTDAPAGQSHPAGAGGGALQPTPPSGAPLQAAGLAPRRPR